MSDIQSSATIKIPSDDNLVVVTIDDKAVFDAISLPAGKVGNWLSKTVPAPAAGIVTIFRHRG